jgi:predicted alpha/beta hydrolase
LPCFPISNSALAQQGSKSACCARGYDQPDPYHANLHHQLRPRDRKRYSGLNPAHNAAMPFNMYFLNGLNVPAFYYSDLATSLATSGFVVATSKYRRDTVCSVPGINATCKPYVFTSSATIDTLMELPKQPKHLLQKVVVRASGGRISANFPSLGFCFCCCNC